jgi:hypothetical protein
MPDGGKDYTCHQYSLASMHANEFRRNSRNKYGLEETNSNQRNILNFKIQRKTNEPECVLLLHNLDCIKLHLLRTAQLRV